MGVASTPRRPLLLALQPAPAWVLLLMALAAGTLLPPPSLAHALGKTLKRQRAAVKPPGPIKPRHRGSASQLSNGTAPGNCTVNPALLLFPEAPCLELAMRTRTANQCHHECHDDEFCVLYSFISNPYLDEPNCFFFAAHESGPHQCHDTDFIPPDPDWRITAFGSWDGGDCSEDPKVPSTTFPFPGECVTSPSAALAPSSSCQLAAHTFNSVEDCFYSCYFNLDCWYFTFYTGTPKGTPNCYSFKQQICDETDHFPPDPEWGTAIYSSYYSTSCPNFWSSLQGLGFAGARGTHIEFVGELGTSYCLVINSEQHTTALVAGYKTDSAAEAAVSTGHTGTQSWRRELEILWRSFRGQEHAVRLAAHSGVSSKAGGKGFLAAAEVDGKRLVLPETPGAILVGRVVNFTFAGSRTQGGTERDVYHLSIPFVANMTLELLPAPTSYQLPSDALVHFSVALNKHEGVQDRLLHCRPSAPPSASWARRIAGVPLPNS